MLNYILGILTGVVITPLTMLYVAGFTRGMEPPKRLKIIGAVGIPLGVVMSLFATYLGNNLF